MGRLAKIKAWNKQSSDSNGCTDYSMNMYWGGSQSTKYTNEFYLCGDMGRPSYDRVIETVTDITGQTKRTQNTSIPRYVVSAIVSSPLLSFLETIDKHDYKEIHFLDTGDIYEIKNIDIEDQGNAFDPVQRVSISFEDEAISKVSSNVYLSDNAKQAFWDNNNNGSKDLDGEAQYDTVATVFNSWQLYFESDGVTPATSGDVLMLVYAVSPLSTPSNTIESLIGVFKGEFGDAFSDSTKWQSTQQIWNFFNLADNVGHTKRVQFDKRGFAKTNGYLSDETEERAIDIRFDLSIDGSGQESTQLSRVYSLMGSFCSYGIQDSSNGAYGFSTIGTSNIKNTLSTVQDIRRAASGGASSSPITVATLTNTTPFSNEYLLDTAPTSEYSYDGGITTKRGYQASCFRGANGLADNFVFTLLETSEPNESPNILNFTTGNDPHLISIWWFYDRNVATGGFPQIGDVTGNAEIYLDGVLVTNVPGIVANPAGLTISGSQAMTLPDTGVHTILLTLQTTGGFEIYTEFEVQINPLF